MGEECEWDSNWQAAERPRPEAQVTYIEFSYEQLAQGLPDCLFGRS